MSPPSTSTPTETPTIKSLKIRAALHQRLRQFCADERLAINDVTDLALTDWLDGHIGFHCYSRGAREDAKNLAIERINQTVDNGISNKNSTKRKGKVT